MACPLRAARLSGGQAGAASGPCTVVGPLRNARTSSTAVQASEGSTPGVNNQLTESIKAKIKVNISARQRRTASPPRPPTLIHSPVFVQTNLIKPSYDGGSETSRLASRPEDEGEEQQPSGTGIVWALKQVDRSLDELENNPLPLQKEIYQFSRSPVGTATSSALTAAAKVTVAASKEAVKAAIPVGQWLIKEGTKAAFSLASRAMAEGAKQQQGGGGGGGGTGTRKISVKKPEK